MIPLKDVGSFGVVGNVWTDSVMWLLEELGVDAVITLYGKRFGKRLETLCDLAQITPKELAKGLGITRVQMSNYLKGAQFPTGVGIIELSIIFGNHPGVILGTNPIEVPPDPAGVRERLEKFKQSK